MVLQDGKHAGVVLLAVLLFACEDGATAPDPVGSASGEAVADALAVGDKASGEAAQSVVIVRREVVRGGRVRTRGTRSGQAHGTRDPDVDGECGRNRTTRLQLFEVESRRGHGIGGWLVWGQMGTTRPGCPRSAPIRPGERSLGGRLDVGVSSQPQ